MAVGVGIVNIFGTSVGVNHPHSKCGVFDYDSGFFGGWSCLGAFFPLFVVVNFIVICRFSSSVTSIIIRGAFRLGFVNVFNDSVVISIGMMMLFVRQCWCYLPSRILSPAHFLEAFTAPPAK